MLAVCPPVKLLNNCGVSHSLLLFFCLFNEDLFVFSRRIVVVLEDFGVILPDKLDEHDVDDEEDDGEDELVLVAAMNDEAFLSVLMYGGPLLDTSIGDTSSSEGESTICMDDLNGCFKLENVPR